MLTNRGSYTRERYCTNQTNFLNRFQEAVKSIGATAEIYSDTSILIKDLEEDIIAKYVSRFAKALRHWGRIKTCIPQILL